MTYAYNPIDSLIATFAGVVFIVILALILIAVAQTLIPRKSRDYRRDITDLYVVAKIKQIADKEGINILEELRQFKKFNKDKKVDFEALDQTIERELQESVQKVDIKEKKVDPKKEE